MAYNILLIGNGGREHAIAQALSQSPLLQKLFIAPGNPGTAYFGKNVTLNVAEFDEVWDFIQQNKIDLTVIGSEQLLVEGIADFLELKNHPVFGPKKQAAMLEGSKEFAKEFMKRNGIPTAEYGVFSGDELEQVEEYITRKNTYPVVIKADGLAAGKGVFIPESEEEVRNILEEIQVSSSLKQAASKLVIEEFMQGEEASVFAICDGESYKIIGNAQDHKRIFDNDKGPNTGGMGAYSPAPIVTDEMLKRVEEEIIAPTIKGMRKEGNPYKGILYCGLMITDEGPKVVEYNCRFGDPECQVILPRLQSDLLELMMACTQEKLHECQLKFDEKYTCCVVLVSGGYPGSYEKGKLISGLNEIQNGIIFHAGTSAADRNIYSNGGRVLNVVGSGKTLQEAIHNTYTEVEKISFDNVFFRRDIGAKGLKHITLK